MDDKPQQGEKLLDVRSLAISRLFDEVPCYISIQDRDYRIVEANRRMRDVFGERIGEPCYTVYKGMVERCQECPVAQTFDDGREHTSETKIFDRRGLPRDVMVHTKALRDTGGRVVAVMELLTDITVKKELEYRLHDSLSRFHTLFDQVPCFISVQNRDLRIVEANSMFTESFGNRLGGYCYEIYKQREDRCPECSVVKTFEDGQVHSSEEIVVDNNGSKINVLVYTAPIRNSRGEITSVMEMSTDITEIRLLQDKLVWLGQLVGGIAHSIKNVLEGLRGGVYIVNLGLRDDNRADIEQGWEMVQRNVNRVSGMILDMLYCAKDRTPRRLPVSVSAVAREVVELFTQRARDYNVALDAELGGVPDISAEPKDIHALISNLVSNAIDACCSDETEDKAHRVLVTTADADGHAFIKVQDNGIGMDSETRTKLFAMFFSTKGAFGTGLGLLVSHKVVTEHGGAISVESELGRGAVFTVKLPYNNEVASSE